MEITKLKLGRPQTPSIKNQKNQVQKNNGKMCFKKGDVGVFKERE
jgi:hypothetical protein